MKVMSTETSESDRIKAVRWEGDKEIEVRIAGFLTGDSAVGEIILSAGARDIYVATDPGHGCWTIGQNDLMGEMGETGWTRELWDCYQAIAEARLAMPLATED